ncbi:tetratricopeptide repeat protein [Parachitinimonas caeni]|uniref:Tetratricopeptide repeat protein n=1 Tax=Parachitinimonas caeni TaxID=3031301 RepID=A0ABT7DWE7_9NEIS|nr:tetratricopeptide repeat protein [Parachitinimonas caeni]MDK2124361.1 tetratricopeptide repeat protein [Parachitinimonas caeni]
MNAEDLNQTIARYQTYLMADPTNLTLQLTLADQLHRAGRFDEALAGYRHCLLQAPGLPAARSRMASVLLSCHQFADAEMLLRSLLAENADDPALRHNLGFSLFYQKRWSEAAECFQQAAGLGLEHPRNTAYWCRSLHHQLQLDEAIKLAQHWLTQSPGNEARCYLAQLYLDHGQMQEAYQCAREVLASDPGAVDALVVAGYASAALQEFDEAQAYFVSAVERQALDARAWQGLGLCYFHLQQFDQAMAALGVVVKLAPDNLGNLVALGWARLMAKDLSGARQAFDQALAQDRNFAEAHGGLAAVLALQGQHDAARSAIRLARRLGPAGFGSEFAHAVLLIQQGQAAEGEAVYDAALARTLPEMSPLPLIEQLRLQAMRKSLGKTRLT